MRTATCLHNYDLHLPVKVFNNNDSKIIKLQINAARGGLYCVYLRH